jgi:hypothetical protein
LILDKTHLKRDHEKYCPEDDNCRPYLLMIFKKEELQIFDPSFNYDVRPCVCVCGVLNFSSIYTLTCAISWDDRSLEKVSSEE